ncbi:uncharacterized protein LOC111087650 [Limulus polyphemus]|uniref:Uncharacterized protein LOC111087650 n=1 Tax=Limulus polyphemus TaxID=6850 RepID=A0ABM1T4B7_LIMPO|nr:uncharacterized protein LOC111087650 [Limulus polyphemus]
MFPSMKKNDPLKETEGYHLYYTTQSENIRKACLRCCPHKVFKPQVLQFLPHEWPVPVPSKVGAVPSGSILIHQQHIIDPQDAIINVADTPECPLCPKPVLVQQYDLTILLWNLDLCIKGFPVLLWNRMTMRHQPINKVNAQKGNKFELLTSQHLTSKMSVHGKHFLNILQRG